MFFLLNLKPWFTSVRNPSAPSSSAAAGSPTDRGNPPKASPYSGSLPGSKGPEGVYSGVPRSRAHHDLRLKWVAAAEKLALAKRKRSRYPDEASMLRINAEIARLETLVESRRADLESAPGR